MNFANSITILENFSVKDIVNIEYCESNENVCHDQEGVTDDFFYFYSCFIIDSHVKFSLDEMTKDILRILNVVLTQLYPNS